MSLLIDQQYGLNDIESFVLAILPHYLKRKRLALSGEMGTGKTTLIRSLTTAMGLRVEVDSPTFGLVNEYVGDGIKMCHFDLYRLNSAEELWNIGWEEYMASDDFLAIEWPERVPEAIDDEFLLLQISIDENPDLRRGKLWDLST